MIGMRHTHSAIFQAVRMGPPFYALDGARERGDDRARARSSRDASLFREMGGLERIARLPATHHRAVQHRPAHVFSPSSHPGGGVFKNAALQVLRTERRLMSTGEVTR
jgi:hypothetical protein